MRSAVGIIYIENDGTSYQKVCQAYETQLLFLVLMRIQEKWDEADAKYCRG